MGSAVKIRELVAPAGDLRAFDPGMYLDSLEFYEADTPIDEVERDNLAQFVHFLAFMALQAKSTEWDASLVLSGSSAYRALQSHFGELDGWSELDPESLGLSYRSLASFLMGYYPPHLPGRTPVRLG